MSVSELFHDSLASLLTSSNTAVTLYGGTWGAIRKRYSFKTFVTYSNVQNRSHDQHPPLILRGPLRIGVLFWMQNLLCLDVLVNTHHVSISVGEVSGHGRKTTALMTLWRSTVMRISRNRCVKSERVGTVFNNQTVCCFSFRLFSV